MTKEVEVGDEFTGKVVKTTTFGAFVELSKGNDGLLHISNVKPGERVDAVEDVLNRGDEIDVRVVEVDKERGRVGLRLADDPDIAGKTSEELASRRHRRQAGGGGGGGGGRDRRGGRDRGGGGGGGGNGGGHGRGPALSADRRPTSHDARSGVRVVTERVPSVRSIALGIWVRTGSRDETLEQAGLSHFLEHLLFKGTDRFTSLEIDEIFDAMGAEVNAGTGKETTTVYSRFLDRHLDAGVRRDGRHGAAPDLPGHRLRAPGGDRGDRDVRGRALGQGARRAGRRRVRRPSAGPADDRHGPR